MDMEEIKIMTWNIKGTSAFSWNNYQIKEDMVNMIMNQKAHIVVLTEFVLAKGIDYLFQKLEEQKYIWFQTCESGSNGIFICVKREILNQSIFNPRSKIGIDRASMYSLNEGLNFLKIRIPLHCGQMLSIIGCRMKTGGLKNKEQYNYESQIFYEILLPEIIKLNSFKYRDDIVVVCGDFNNAMCRDKLNEKFKTKEYIGKDQLNYNLNIIKDEFDALGYVMVDVDEEGNAMPTYRHMSKENNIPDDHIFIRGGECKVDENGKKQCEVVSAESLSDHDILLATVDFHR